MKQKQTYVAFLRGINVGGHHKVPMADLKKELQKLGFDNITTLLNSGNIIFDTNKDDLENLEQAMSEHLEKTFGFPIPTIIKTSDSINKLLKSNPFKDITVTKDIRLYVSFLRRETESDMQLPWKSEDHSFLILEKKDSTIVSILDLSKSKTPKAMEVVEKNYGKDITTRNWKTIERIGTKIT